MIIQGDCLEKLKELEDNSVDSIVTDPPYELGFMGKKWDNSSIAYNVDMWAECLRVLKPGGHLLAFGGTRTYHRMTVAIEDAGFEVRDMIEWVYGSGMSKCNVWGKGKVRTSKSLNAENDLMVENGWEGWGKGGLKPAHEPICMARKPLAEKTVAENCLKWGTGGINIDESRVESSQEDKDILDAKSSKNPTGVKSAFGGGIASKAHEQGRFPANLILGADENGVHEEVRECFPETKSGKMGPQHTRHTDGSPNGIYGKFDVNHELGETYGDSGNASRFFKSILYYPKASKSERNKGCEGLEEKEQPHSTNMKCANCGLPILSGTGQSCKCENKVEIRNKAKNNHPTVKPIALMEYLIKMITPKGGTVLDPFAGSGSTLVAAKQNGYKYIGIELTEEYIPIIEARLEAVKEIKLL